VGAAFKARGANAFARGCGRGDEADFIPHIGIDPRLEEGCAAFHHHRQNAAFVKGAEDVADGGLFWLSVFPNACGGGLSFWKGNMDHRGALFGEGGGQGAAGLRPQDDADGLEALPMSDGQAGLIDDGGVVGDHDGVFAASPFMDEIADGFVAYVETFVGPPDDGVEGLGPFEDDVRTLLLVKGEEAAVEGLGFFLEEADGDVEAVLLEVGDAFSVDDGVGVGRGDDDAAQAPADQVGGAGGRFSVVVAGFEGDVEGGAFDGFVGEGIQGHPLGVGLACAMVPSFADDAAVPDHHGAHVGVGIGPPVGAAGEVEGALHPSPLGCVCHLCGGYGYDCARAVCGGSSPPAKKISRPSSALVGGPAD